MRRIVLLITICCQVFWVAAQKKAPKWMDKQRKAVVTVTTYGKDNQKKASGTGFFITETGEALSGYSLFKDAARATVTDADGKVQILFTQSIHKRLLFVSTNHKLSKNYPLTTLLIDTYYNPKKLESQGQ